MRNNNPHNNQLVRTRLDNVDDSGGQQRVAARGRKNEILGSSQRRDHRLGLHGHAYNPPSGSQGFAIIIGGNPDQAMHAGYEHPDKRMKDLKPGEAALYFDRDNYILMKDNGDIYMKCKGNIILDPQGKIYLGGSDANRELALKNSIDSDGDAEVANLSDKVLGK